MSAQPAKKHDPAEELEVVDDPIGIMAKRVYAWIMSHKKETGIAAAALCVLILIVSGTIWYIDYREDKAAALLSSAMDEFTRLEKGGNVSYEKIKKDFDTLVTQYSSTSAGKLACIPYATVCLNSGDAEKAVKLYQKAIDIFDDDLKLGGILYIGLAHALEASGKTGEAIDAFKKASQMKDSPARAEALFFLGKLYAEKNQADLSKKAFDDLVKEFPDSMYARIARERAGS